RLASFRPCTAREFESTLVAAGFPKDDAHFVAGLVEKILDGRNASTADGVEEALGRKPGSFAAFCERAHAGGVWSRHR
ncbi:MAG: NmrA family transcriptional regulator, partial [Myxococcota bacterium]